VDSTVKCSKCGFENRGGARYCKGCGRVLQAQAARQTPSTPLGVICPACGFTTAKPGARFCLRCGEPLPTAVPGQPSTRPVMPLPPALAKTPPLEPGQQGRSLWWMWALGGVGALGCLVFLGIAAAFVVPGIIKGGEASVAEVVATDEPSPTSVAPTATPGPTDTPIPSPLPTSTAVVSETPTPFPTETPSPSPTAAPLPVAALPPLAAINIALSTDSLRINDLLTVTVAITNTGEVSFREARCQLVGEWSSQLELMGPPAVTIPGEIEPGASRAVVFVLKAVQAGTARIQVSVTMEAVGADPPLLGSAFSDSLELTVLE
jgi:hypothetical protein